jgi:hypothetical protein
VITAQRAAERVAQIRNNIRVDDFGCWHWLGDVNDSGYRRAPIALTGPEPNPIDHTCGDC